MEPFDQTGRFWLPGLEHRSIAGVLKFDRDDGALLTLIGALHHEPAIGTPQSVNQLILGQAGNSDVTLVRCNLMRSSWDHGGGLEETWRPHAILRGACLDHADMLAFDEVYFEVDALLEWTNRATIQRKYRDDGERMFTGVDIEHHEVPAETIDLDDGGTLGIRFPWTAGGDGLRWATVRQSCVIERQWTSPQPLDEVLEEVRFFQHLLTLATNDGCSYGSITLHHPEVVVQRPDRTYRDPIKLYASPKANSLREVPLPQMMLFRLDDLGGIAGLKRWRDTAVRYSRVLNLATSLRYQPGMFGENKLSTESGAAEALHRLMFPDKAIPDAEYKSIKKSMLDAVTDRQQRQHLVNQLQHANEHYLSARLRQLAEHAAPASQLVVGDADRWARVVADVRNDLTHPTDAPQERPAASGSDLFFLAESLYLVIAMCILLEVGLSTAALEAALRQPKVEWAAKGIQATVDRLRPPKQIR